MSLLNRLSGVEKLKDDKEEGKYMIRRKFYIPEKEVNRDYRVHENHPSNYLFDSDFEESESDED